ncbi:hypothetical protein [Aeromonas jandaei]|uniref:hypothetical protein n=1 Tax=Aeromonas jandaei TaxID=650 RepID=UPI003BA30BCA
MQIELVPLTPEETLSPGGLALQQRVINSQPTFNLALGGPAALSLSAIRQDAEAVLAAGGRYLVIRRQQRLSVSPICWPVTPLMAIPGLVCW